MAALATPELTAKSLAMVGGVYKYLAAVYLLNNSTTNSFKETTPKLPKPPE